MANFRPSGLAYNTAAPASLIPLRDVEPPVRFPEHPLDHRGFDRARLASVLAGIVAGKEIEPVSVTAIEHPPVPCDPGLALAVHRSPFSYRVRDGFHRYHASVAAGFERLPALIVG